MQGMALRRALPSAHHFEGAHMIGDCIAVVFVACVFGVAAWLAYNQER